MWITHGFMGLDGRDIEYTHGEWVEQECGTPIFGSKSEGCRSCLKGWSVPESQILDNDHNKKLLKKAKRLNP